MGITRKTVSNWLDANEFDNIEVENTLADDMEGLGLDVMSDPLLELSAEEMATAIEVKKRDAKIAKEKEREETKRKAAIAKRIALLSDVNAHSQYNRLMDEMPVFDESEIGFHWSANLVRILNAIGYKHSVDNLANPQSILGDIESITYIAIVKSHLSLATFDHIYTQMSDYLIANPDFKIQNYNIEETTTIAYADTTKHKLDEKADSSADPNWGSY